MKVRLNWKLTETGVALVTRELKTRSIEEVAADLGVHRNTLASWICNGHAISLTSRRALVDRWGTTAVEIEEPPK